MTKHYLPAAPATVTAEQLEADVAEAARLSASYARYGMEITPEKIRAQRDEAMNFMAGLTQAQALVKHIRNLDCSITKSGGRYSTYISCIGTVSFTAKANGDINTAAVHAADENDPYYFRTVEAKAAEVTSDRLFTAVLAFLQGGGYVNVFERALSR